MTLITAIVPSFDPYLAMLLKDGDAMDPTLVQRLHAVPLVDVPDPVLSARPDARPRSRL